MTVTHCAISEMYFPGCGWEIKQGKPTKGSFTPWLKRSFADSRTVREQKDWDSKLSESSVFIFLPEAALDIHTPKLGTQPGC